MPTVEPERHMLDKHLNSDKKPFTCHCAFAAACLSDIIEHSVHSHGGDLQPVVVDLECFEAPPLASYDQNVARCI